MLNLFTALMLGFACGFVVACVWMRRTMRTWERAYKLATEEHRAMYEQRNAGVEGMYVGTICDKSPMDSPDREKA